MRSHLPWEPSLQIALLRRGVVQLPRDNIDNAVRKTWKHTDELIIAKYLVKLAHESPQRHITLTQHLVEHFSVGEHEIEFFPRDVIVRRSDDKLLDFLELVDAENAASVASVRSHFLSETRG